MQEGFYSYLLPILKLLGILLTGVFGMAEHFRKKGKSIESQERSRRWNIIGILLSVSVAFSAELIDTIQKKHEAIDAAKRAEESAQKTLVIMSDLDRSLHPLFPISVYAWFNASLDSFANPQKKSAAYAFSTTYLQARIFFVKTPATSTTSPEMQNPDLSFPLQKTYNLPDENVDAAHSKTRSVLNKDVTNKNGLFSMYIPIDTINTSDCYSNGKIVSSLDLVGAQMMIETSPYFELKADIYAPALATAVQKAFMMEYIDIEFPGTQEIQLHLKDFKVSKKENRTFYVFNFPKNKEDMAKMFLP